MADLARRVERRPGPAQRLAQAGQGAALRVQARHCGEDLAALRTKVNQLNALLLPNGLQPIAREADLLVAAIGRAGFVRGDFVKPGAVVVDVGMHRVTDAAAVDRLYAGNPKKTAAFAKRGSVLSGDVDFMAVAPKASRITPVPGGVGPLTIAMLMACHAVGYR